MQEVEEAEAEANADGAGGRGGIESIAGDVHKENVHSFLGPGRA